MNFLLTTVIVEILQLGHTVCHFSFESLQEAKQSRKSQVGLLATVIKSLSLLAHSTLDLLHSVNPHFQCSESKTAFLEALGNSKCSTTTIRKVEETSIGKMERKSKSGIKKMYIPKTQ